MDTYLTTHTTFRSDISKKYHHILGCHIQQE